MSGFQEKFSRNHQSFSEDKKDAFAAFHPEPETTPPFSSFNRFLLLSSDQRKANLNAQSLFPMVNLNSQKESQISDWVLPNFEGSPEEERTRLSMFPSGREPFVPLLVYDRDQMSAIPKNSNSKSTKTPRAFILNEPRDTSFDSDSEQYDRTTLNLIFNNSTNGKNEHSDQKKMVFMTEESSSLTEYQDSGIDFGEFLDILNDKISDKKNVNFKYKCQYCGQGFKTGCGLGGHVSKVHMGLKADPKKKRTIKDFKHFDKERSRYFRKFKK